MDTIPRESTFTKSEEGEELIIPDDNQPFLRASIKTEPSEIDTRNPEEASELEDPYQCFVCGVDCESQQELISHYEALHAEESKYDPRNEDGEAADDMDDDPLAGDEAPASIVDGVKHENIEAFETRENRTPLNLYICSVCGFTLNGTVEELSRHMLQHVTVTPISCEDCKYIFSERYHLKNHIRHPQEAPHMCVHCPFRCVDLQAIKDHCVTHHQFSHSATDTGKELVIATAVNPSINRPGVMPPLVTRHPQPANVTNVKPNFMVAIPNGRRVGGSDMTGRSTEIKPSITLEEMLKSNAENVPARCFRKIARKIAPAGSERIQPQWKIVPTPTPTVEEPLKIPKMGDRARKHPCPYCSFKARDSYSLKVHVYRHTQEKPFACSLCHYRATQRAHLQKHFRVHIKRGELDFSEVRVSTHSDVM